MNYYYRSLFFITALILYSAPLYAQNKQGDENSMLPDINPQDIEIRSEFKARFPGLRRQPILGFEPSQRVFQIDPNRLPYIESSDQVVANIPVSQLSRPEPPAYSSPYYSPDINAYGRLGFGSFISPEAQFWGAKHITSKSYIAGNFDFSSSDGHLSNQASSFRFFTGDVEYATKLNAKTRLDVNAGFDNSFNHLFNLNPSLGVPNTSRKKYDGYHFGGQIKQFQNDVSGWKAQADVRSYDVALNAGNKSGQSDELVYNASGSKSWAGAHPEEVFSANLGLKGGSFENAGYSDNWFTGRLGASYNRLFNYNTSLDARLNLYYGSDPIDQKVYVGPSVKVEYPFLNIFTLKVKAEGKPYLRTVEQLNQTNRFVNVSNNLRHSYKLGGQAELKASYSPLGSLNFGVKYDDISSYPTFRRQSNAGNGSAPFLFYETNYADVYKARAYVGVNQQFIPEKFWLSGKLYAQSPRIKNGGRIPFEEKVGFRSSLGIRPIKRLTFEASADYVGSRRTFQTNEKLNGFFLLGGQIDVNITGRFGAYVKIVNLLSQDYQVWQGYTERPMQIYGGLTVKL